MGDSVIFTHLSPSLNREKQLLTSPGMLLAIRERFLVTFDP